MSVRVCFASVSVVCPFESIYPPLIPAPGACARVFAFTPTSFLQVRLLFRLLRSSIGVPSSHLLFGACLPFCLRCIRRHSQRSVKLLTPDCLVDVGIRHKLVELQQFVGVTYTTWNRPLVSHSIDPTVRLSGGHFLCNFIEISVLPLNSD